MRSAIGLASANLDTQLGDLPTASEIRAEVDASILAYDPPTKAELDTAQSSIEGDIAAISAPTAEEIREEMDDNSTELAAIKGKTNLIPGLF
jgi:hypothetical protein